jgi:hypothetical protein
MGSNRISFSGPGPLPKKLTEEQKQTEELKKRIELIKASPNLFGRLQRPVGK